MGLPRNGQGLNGALGAWGDLIEMPNVAIHTHVLPNGKVLFWGRRDRPDLTLNETSCTPIVWDLQANTFTGTAKPTLEDGVTTVNLFCSGHTFLADGRLLVAGGHLTDGNGVNQACLFDSTDDTWTATSLMNNGRWYPTLVTMPEGGALVLSGSFEENGRTVNNDVQQVWSSGAWTSRVNFIGLPLYPRMHVAPDGRAFMSGSLGLTQSLDVNDPPGLGTWTPIGSRGVGSRDYAPSVMYGDGKVLYIGGGNDPSTLLPSNTCETIDLGAPDPAWIQTGPMNFRRRQHNATLLPDGAVLVTGGTQGGGGPNPGFNDLTPGQPVHAAEVWDPVTGQWTVLAEERADRCYHATAVLLPDATVLSAGGGEFFPVESAGQANDPRDSHRDGQIFSPPYLFKGQRPAITGGATGVGYGEAFEIDTPDAATVARVSWVRLPSVTHSFDQNQRINFLQFVQGDGRLTVTAPANANVCPPGHYMLFLLNQNGVPSTARIIRIQTGPALIADAVPLALAAPQVSGVHSRMEEIAAADKGTHVVVGLTGTCPYGIGACWGGAYEGLTHMQGAVWVETVPNADDSTASVYLKDDILPDIGAWRRQFQSSANGSYGFRGLEVTVTGVVETSGGGLVMSATDIRPAITLGPLGASDKIQWDRAKQQPQPANQSEIVSFSRLEASVIASQPDGTAATVTGPLRQTDAGYALLVRAWIP